MRTPSHFLITAALNKGLEGRVVLARGACLIGSVAPDIPLFLLAVSTALYLRVVEGRPIDSIHSFMFNDLFFQHPLWVVSHNLLHAPLLLLLGLVLSWPFRAQPGTIRHWLFWFFMTDLLHTTLDIATHYNDGPLLLFPFNWTLRFQSPVSYWDPEHYGTVFTLFEYALDIALLGYLAFSWYRQRLGRM